MEVAGAIAEGTLAEGFLSCLGEGGWGGELAGGSTKSGAKVRVDLTDLGDLFQGGADKVGEAFPGIFAEGSQSGVSFLGGGEGEVGGGESGEKRGPSEI